MAAAESERKSLLPLFSKGKLSPLKIQEQRGFGHFKQRPVDCVIPAWSAGIQIDMDVSGSILANLDAGYPCRHDEVRIFHSLG